MAWCQSRWRLFIDARRAWFWCCWWHHKDKQSQCCDNTLWWWHKLAVFHQQACKVNCSHHQWWSWYCKGLDIKWRMGARSTEGFKRGTWMFSTSEDPPQYLHMYKSLPLLKALWWFKVVCVEAWEVIYFLITGNISATNAVSGICAQTDAQAKGYLLTSSIPEDKLLPDGEARIDMDLCEKWHNRKRCRVLRPNRVISEPDIPTHVVKGVEAGLPVVSSLSNSEHRLQLLDDHTNQVHCEKGNGIGAVKNHVAKNEAAWHVVSGQLASACSLGQTEDFKTQSCDKENNIDNKQQYLSQCNLSRRQQQFLQRLPLETCSESNTNIWMIQHKLPKKDLQSFWQGYHHHQDRSEPVVIREDMPIDGVWMCPKLHRRPQIRAKQGSLDTWLH